MSSSWVPPWLGWTWVLALTVVTVVHLRHLVRLPDVTRVWHLGHVLTALGMIAMFWPGGALLRPPSGVLGIAVFTAGALAVAAWSVVDRSRRGRWTLVWPLLALDMAAMVWMFVTMAPVGEAAGPMAAGSMSTGPAAVDAVIGAWFAVEALGWASGWLVRASEHDLHLELPVVGGEEAVPARSDAGASGARGGAAPAVPAGFHGEQEPLAAGARGTRGSAWHGRSLRVTLTLMSASMAFMLLTMALGPTHGPTGPGMTDMTGMTSMSASASAASADAR